MKVKGLRVVAFVDRQAVHKAVHQLRALRSVALHHFGPLALGQVPSWAAFLQLQAAPDACCAQHRAEIREIQQTRTVGRIAQRFIAGLRSTGWTPGQERVRNNCAFFSAETSLHQYIFYTYG